jgi:hypothetical protein
MGQTGAEIVAELESQALSPVVPDQWPGVISGIADKAEKLFDVDIARVIVSGWGKYRELREYAIADRHNPETPIAHWQTHHESTTIRFSKCCATANRWANRFRRKIIFRHGRFRADDSE